MRHRTVPPRVTREGRSFLALPGIEPAEPRDEARL
jgi:hypothetical protein